MMKDCLRDERSVIPLTRTERFARLAFGRDA